MASILKVDDLRGNTAAGDITITSEGGAATMQLQQGVAKAWVNLDGSGTVTLLDSFNIASVGDNGTGDFTFNFSNNMSNTTYCPVADVQSTVLTYSLKNTGIHTLTTSSERHTFGSGASETGKQDLAMNTVLFAGDLA